MLYCHNGYIRDETDIDLIGYRISGEHQGLMTEYLAAEYSAHCHKHVAAVNRNEKINYYLKIVRVDRDCDPFICWSRYRNKSILTTSSRESQFASYQMSTTLTAYVS